MAPRQTLSERSLSIALATMVLCLVCGPSAGCQEDGPLSLAEALAHAVNHNPRLAAAASRVAQADAEVGLARSRAEPVFTLRASGRLQGPVQEIDIPIAGGKQIRINRPDQASASIGVVWPVWTGGRVSAAADAARAQVDAAEADLQQAIEQLLFEVGAAYFRVLQARSGRDAAQAALARADEDLRVAAIRQRAGVLTAARVAEAEAARSRAQEELAAAGSAVENAEEALNRLLARPLGAPVLLVDEPVTMEVPGSEEEAASIALSSRPELLALEHRLESAEATIRQARSERNPTLSATAQAGWQTPTEVMQAHSEFVGLEFAWPILNYAGSRAQERQAAARMRELAETRQDLEGLIRSQATETARHVSDAREALVAAEQGLAAAGDRAREVRMRYEAGAATGQQVISADCALEETSARHQAARHAVSLALMGRARALGLMRALILVPPEEVNEP